MNENNHRAVHASGLRLHAAIAARCNAADAARVVEFCIVNFYLLSRTIQPLFLAIEDEVHRFRFV